MKRTLVKVVAVREQADVPNWPCINHDADKELRRIMIPVRAMNPDMDFNLVTYTDVKQAEADYEEDVKKYDGVLVLVMTCWKKIDVFYILQSQKGIPTIVADVPYCGSGSVLQHATQYIRKEKLPVPLLSTLNYNEIAEAVRAFDVIAKMKQTKVLVITDRQRRTFVEEMQQTWGCRFIYKTGKELNEYMTRVDRAEAAEIAKRWCAEAVEVREVSDEEMLDSAALHLALRQMMEDTHSDSVTVDCLGLSYNDGYTNGKHLYPCMSHYEMLNQGKVAVCEADICATVTSLIVQYLTDRPGFVSDPVIDTSCDQIIYAHCVGSTKVYGQKDARTCQYAVRSHAEDQKGASVQIIFPLGDKVTTTMVYPGEAVIHSGRAVGNVGLQEACRSKLAAETNAQSILEKWSHQWHRVTVFGDYRKLLMQLYKIKGLSVIEEDKQ